MKIQTNVNALVGKRNPKNGEIFNQYVDEKVIENDIEVIYEANKASGDFSHAEGYSNKALGIASHSGGKSNIAGYDYQTVLGKFNSNKSTNIFEIGFGENNTSRKNIFEIDKEGNAYSNSKKLALFEDLESKVNLPNILNFEDVETTVTNGITYSVKNGVIKINGTANGQTVITLSYKITENGGTFYYKNFGDTDKFIIRDGETNTYGVKDIHEGTATFENFVGQCFIKLLSGEVITNATIKPMLVRGNYVPSYFYSHKESVTFNRDLENYFTKKEMQEVVLNNTETKVDLPNIFCLKDKEYTNDNVSISIKDNVITLNGTTTTPSIYNFILDTKINLNGDYVLKAFLSENKDIVLTLNEPTTGCNSSNNFTYAYNFNDKELGSVAMYFDATTFNNFKIKLMLVNGKVAPIRFLNFNNSVASNLNYYTKGKLDSDFTFNGNKIFSGNVQIYGDFLVTGTTTTINTQTVSTKDNIIELASGRSSTTPITTKVGLEVKNYDGTDKIGQLVFDNTGTAYVGDSDDLQPLTTRKNLTDGFIPKWDNTSSSLVNGIDINTIATIESLSQVSSVLTSDIQKKQDKILKFTDITASNWVDTNDTNYGKYIYKCELSLTGVKDTYIASVVFKTTDAASGKYSPVCDTADGKIIIYSKVNNEIVIPTITVEVF